MTNRPIKPSVDAIQISRETIFSPTDVQLLLDNGCPVDLCRKMLGLAVSSGWDIGGLLAAAARWKKEKA